MANERNTPLVGRFRFLEVHYHRAEISHHGKVVPARVETVVIFVPDVWSATPNRVDWEKLNDDYKSALERRLNPKLSSPEPPSSATPDKSAADDKDADTSKAHQPYLDNFLLLLRFLFSGGDNNFDNSSSQLRPTSPALPFIYPSSSELFILTTSTLLSLESDDSLVNKSIYPVNERPRRSDDSTRAFSLSTVCDSIYFPLVFPSSRSYVSLGFFQDDENLDNSSEKSDLPKKDPTHYSQLDPKSMKVGFNVDRNLPY